MIAANYIKYPEALRFQVEMFSNGYHNSPRIMRLMECIMAGFFKPTTPQWVKDMAQRAKALVKRWKAAQVLMNFTDRSAIVAGVTAKKRAQDVAHGKSFGRRLGSSIVYVGPYGECWTGKGQAPAWINARLREFGEPWSTWAVEC